jgi:hypothetical protein
MHSPARAIAWELWRRHRRGLAAYLAYVLTAAAVWHVVRAEDVARSIGQTFFAEAMACGELGVVELTVAIGNLSALPAIMGLVYLFAVFGYGFQADLAMKDSNYPRRMFVLPVPTRTLVVWPMLYGAVALALAWVGLAAGILWPCDLAVPLGVPALEAAALLAWIQAISWSPFGAYGVKVAAMVAVATALAAVPLVGILELGAPHALVAAGLAASLPAAYGVAAVGVARARRGDAPDWSRWSDWLRERISRLPRRRRPFASAASAQVWFEWRRHGINLPLMVALFMPWFLPILAVAEKDAVLVLIISMIALPPFLAMFAASTVSKTNPWVKDYYGVTPFTAVRPMTCGGLVAAKLTMAALSTLAAWAVILAAVALALAIPGCWAAVAAACAAGAQQLGPFRFSAVLLMIAAGLVLFTWKNLVENVFLGLTGRAWVINGGVAVGSGLFGVLGLFGAWLYYHPAYWDLFFAALPWLLAGAVALKLLAAGWACRAACRSGLVAAPTLARLLALWLLAVVGLTGLLCWLLPAGAVAVHAVALGVVLFVPLARLSAAPLALAWNRHR